LEQISPFSIAPPGFSSSDACLSVTPDWVITGAMRIHTRTPSLSAIEILEARVAPAGIVTVTFAGGVLTLDGDGADNVIDMSPFGADGYLLSD
jgi:hypothetical protein